ncbi:MAG: GGDEF domain-containing protein [Acidimicrobiales bacterium]
MATHDAGGFDRVAVEALGRSWRQRCVATGCASGPDDEEERDALLVAFEQAATADAIAQVRGTLAGRSSRPSEPRPASTIAARRKVLDVAAKGWGARIASPTLAVEQLLLLRHLVSRSSEGERLGRLVDRAILISTRAATDELQLAAFTDSLTGCANRRAFERDLERELARCTRAELDLCVIALDVDGLKHVNDSDGHAAGDRVLLLLVETLRRALRGLDGVYRVGGDEFVIILPDTSPEGGAVVMSRVEHLGAPAFSWGLANYFGVGSTNQAELLRAADEQLYELKRQRRGLVSALPSGRDLPARLETEEESQDPTGLASVIRSIS